MPKPLNAEVDALNSNSSSNATVSIFTSKMFFYKYGKIVVALYQSDLKSGVATGDLGTIGTIPAGYRPKFTVSICTSKDCTVTLRITLNPIGSITAYNYSAATTVTTLGRFHPATYYVD